MIALHPLLGWGVALLLAMAALIAPNGNAAANKVADDSPPRIFLTDPARVTVIVPGRTRQPEPTDDHDSDHPRPTDPPAATAVPTAVPTQRPTDPPPPTAVPTQRPTDPPAPTAIPTQRPTNPPAPTAVPTQRPTDPPAPTAVPTAVPTAQPTSVPTAIPSQQPTDAPVPTTAPTLQPTANPTEKPTDAPAPTQQPSATTPAQQPTKEPTQPPQPSATTAPVARPSATPVGPNPTATPSPVPQNPGQPNPPQPAATADSGRSPAPTQAATEPAATTPLATPLARQTTAPAIRRTPILRLPKPTATAPAPDATLTAPTVNPASATPADAVIGAPDSAQEPAATPAAVADVNSVPAEAAPANAAPAPVFEPDIAPAEENLSMLPPEDPPAQSNLVYVYSALRIDAEHTLIAGCVANIGNDSEYNVNMALDMRTTRAKITAMRSGSGPAAINARQANANIAQIRPGEARQMDVLIEQTGLSLSDRHYRFNVHGARMLSADTLGGRVKLTCAPRDLSAAADDVMPARFLIDGETAEASTVAKIFASQGLPLRQVAAPGARMSTTAPVATPIPAISTATLLSLLASSLLLLGLIGAAVALHVLD